MGAWCAKDCRERSSAPAPKRQRFISQVSVDPVVIKVTPPTPPEHQVFASFRQIFILAEVIQKYFRCHHIFRVTVTDSQSRE